MADGVNTRGHLHTKSLHPGKQHPPTLCTKHHDKQSLSPLVPSESCSGSGHTSTVCFSVVCPAWVSFHPFVSLSVQTFSGCKALALVLCVQHHIWSCDISLWRCHSGSSSCVHLVDCSCTPTVSLLQPCDCVASSYLSWALRWQPSWDRFLLGVILKCFFFTLCGFCFPNKISKEGLINVALFIEQGHKVLKRSSL